MKKQAAMIAICAALLICVAAAGCTSSTSPSPNAAATANSSSHAATANSSSHAATASATAKASPSATGSPSAKASPSATPTSGATQLIDIQSSPTGDLHAGEQVTTTGRLVDANGNGIPNQQVTFMAQAPIVGTTTQGSATTDSTGAFQHVNTVSAGGLPLSGTITVTGWIEYAGNGVYQPTSSPHVPETVHLS
ncbi:MAG TPA: hypothetical protein VEF35_09310 [Candidatus Bathyarchaeia archaeon]|nr:hypothetical protein [Candidatus Bathyarchaeia archaeon]